MIGGINECVPHSSFTSVDAQAAEFLTAWFEVRQLIQTLNFNRFQGAGLSATQFTLLNVLNTDKPTTVTALARRLNVHAATVVRSLDSLERRGLVVRSRNPSDRREVWVVTTPAGEKFQNGARGDFTQQIIQILSAMSDGGREALVKGYREFAEVGRKQIPAKPRE